MAQITLTRGDYFDGEIAEWIIYDDGVVVDLTGYTAQILIRTQKRTTFANHDTDGSAGARLVIPTGTDGKIVPDIQESETTDWPIADDHEYDLVLTNPAGKSRRFVNLGSLEVTEAIAAS